jgi:hypothetical protein
MSYSYLNYTAGLKCSEDDDGARRLPAKPPQGDSSARKLLVYEA